MSRWSSFKSQQVLTENWRKFLQEEDEAPEEGDQLTGIDRAISIAENNIVPKAQAGMFPKEIQEKIQEFVPPEQPSLLEKPEQTQSESLLSREE